MAEEVKAVEQIAMCDRRKPREAGRKRDCFIPSNTHEQATQRWSSWRSKDSEAQKHRLYSRRQLYWMSKDSDAWNRNPRRLQEQNCY